MCIYIYVCVCVCVYIYIYIYIYKFVCIYIYVCMYIYIYIYIYIYYHNLTSDEDLGEDFAFACGQLSPYAADKFSFVGYRRPFVNQEGCSF